MPGSVHRFSRVTGDYPPEEISGDTWKIALGTVISVVALGATISLGINARPACGPAGEDQALEACAPYQHELVDTPPTSVQLPTQIPPVAPRHS